jgi:hypothetical protein
MVGERAEVRHQRVHVALGREEAALPVENHLGNVAVRVVLTIGIPVARGRRA